MLYYYFHVDVLAGVVLSPQDTKTVNFVSLCLHFLILFNFEFYADFFEIVLVSAARVKGVTVASLVGRYAASLAIVVMLSSLNFLCRASSMFWDVLMRFLIHIFGVMMVIIIFIPCFCRFTIFMWASNRFLGDEILLNKNLIDGL